MIPTHEDFDVKLNELFKHAQLKKQEFIDVISEDLHRLVGGYPAKEGNHRMPVCCNVMKRLMKIEDQILKETPSGQSSTLKIRYFLPR